MTSESKAEEEKKCDASSTMIVIEPPIDELATTGTENILYSFFLALNATVQTPCWSMVLGALLHLLLMIFVTSTVVRSILIIYLIYCIFDTSPSNGGHFWMRYEWMERCRWFPLYYYFRKYFPARLVKTAELDPSKSYLMLYHPHGIICIGASLALISNYCNFTKLFPGIRRRGATLNAVLMLPFFRDWLLALGMISANKKSIKETLTKRKQSVFLVPGGSAEALLAKEKTMRFYLKKRKGFIRLSLETGSPVVPCIGFGENEVFSTLSFDTASSAFQLQYWVAKLLTFSVPIITWPVPRRTPVTVVVGKPVIFKSDKVDECHEQYIQELRALFEQHKKAFGCEGVELEIC